MATEVADDVAADDATAYFDSQGLADGRLQFVTLEVALTR